MKRLLILLLCILAHSASMEAKKYIDCNSARHYSNNFQNYIINCADNNIPSVLVSEDSVDEDFEILRKTFQGTFCIFHPAVIRNYQAYRFVNIPGRKQAVSILIKSSVLRL